ncbi:hypothetical protein [Sphingomonas sp.]|uniref:hypothetical protein n=1 Tax=Sphingomonas sp. TaxID=28214 RepID=UPI002FD9259C
MLARTHLLMAPASAAFALALPLSPQQLHDAPSQADARSEADIVVTATRLRATKVDYRFRGAAIVYCGARDRHQDASSVATICDMLAACALGGARKPEALSDCVEDRLAARTRRRE